MRDIPPCLSAHRGVGQSILYCRDMEGTSLSSEGDLQSQLHDAPLRRGRVGLSYFNRVSSLGPPIPPHLVWPLQSGFLQQAIVVE